MTYDDIKSVLGDEVVDELQAAVKRAYVASQATGTPDVGQQAISELLVAMLAAVLVTPTTCEGAPERVTTACARLEALVGAACTAYAGPATRMTH